MNLTTDKIEQFYQTPRVIKNIEVFFSGHSFSYHSLPNFYTRNYFSVFNPVFLHRLSDADILKEEVVLLARDGLFDLLQFFIGSPVPPKGTKAIFLFPSEFSSFIPHGWRERSLGYFYQHKNLKVLEKPTKYIISGHLCIDSSPLEELQKNLVGWKSEGQVLALVEMGAPEYANYIHQFKANSFKLYKEFFSTMPETSRYIYERELLAINLNQTWQHIDLSTRPFLIYDKWCERQFYSCGVQGSSSANFKINHKCYSTAISPYENINIAVWKSTGKSFKEIYLDHKVLNVDKWDFHRAFRENIITLYNQR